MQLSNVTPRNHPRHYETKSISTPINSYFLFFIFYFFFQFTVGLEWLYCRNGGRWNDVEFLEEGKGESWAAAAIEIVVGQISVEQDFDKTELDIDDLPS